MTDRTPTDYDREAGRQFWANWVGPEARAQFVRAFMGAA